MGLTIRLKRGDIDDLMDAASNEELIEAEPFYITGLGKIGVATSSNEYNIFTSTIIVSSLTLTVAGWSSNSQTLTVNGVTGVSTNIISINNAVMGDRWAASKVYAESQGSNSITFTCQIPPTEPIIFSITILK